MIRSCKRGGEIPKCISSNQNIVNLKTFPKAKNFYSGDRPGQNFFVTHLVE